eukprot:m.90784 g.90784  ORF g.90784 m.90784 type:complete len:54 (-) comp12926_c0_seq3:1130-1291(-)
MGGCSDTLPQLPVTSMLGCLSILSIASSFPQYQCGSQREYNERTRSCADIHKY